MEKYYILEGRVSPEDYVGIEFVTVPGYSVVFIEFWVPVLICYSFFSF